MFQYFQAFKTVLNCADSGNSSNTTANDIRTIVTSAYLSGSPNFSSLNLALYAALRGNWSAFSYASFGPVATNLLAPILPLICLDMRKLIYLLTSLYFLLNHVLAVHLDIDDNTFTGFNNIQQNIAKYDPAQFRYTQDLGFDRTDQCTIEVY